MNDIVGLIYAYARAVWRRRWVAVVAAWLIALPAWAYVLWLPDRYEASATVFVDARTPLRPVLEGIAIQEDYESQLSLVREALLSRTELENVARQTKLDAAVRTPADMDTLVSALQEQIGVYSATPATNGQSRDTIYTIVYQHEDREMSVKVVQELLNNFVEGTQSSNRAGAGEVQDFLVEQITQSEQRLQAAEERLSEFKKRHIGMIPGERGDYFSRLNQEMAGLQQAETNLAVAISRRAELQRQLANTQPYLPGTAASGSGISTVAPLDVTLRRQEAEQRLEGLLQRFTTRHPDVIALQKTVEELKSREVTELAELKRRETAELAELQRGGTGTGAIRSLSANPVHQQIQTQLSQVQVEIASHQGQAEQHRREIANLRQFVDKAPEIEQEYARLDRDYGVMKHQYDLLVTQRERARVSDDAARNGIVRFDVIEQPRASLDPVSPQRELLLILTLFAAIGAGIGLAMVPRLLSPTFDDIASLERKLGVPVLGAVSAVPTAAHREDLRRAVLKVAFAGGALVVLGGVVMFAADTGVRVLHDLITWKGTA